MKNIKEKWKVLNYQKKKEEEKHIINFPKKGLFSTHLNIWNIIFSFSESKIIFYFFFNIQKTLTVYIKQQQLQLFSFSSKIRKCSLKWNVITHWIFVYNMTIRVMMTALYVRCKSSIFFFILRVEFVYVWTYIKYKNIFPPFPFLFFYLFLFQIVSKDKRVYILMKNKIQCY